MRTFLKILKFVLIFALAVSVSFVLGLTIGVLVKGGRRVVWGDIVED